MISKDVFRNLYNFVGAWFPDAAIIGYSSDDDVVQDYVNTESNDVIDGVVKELELILSDYENFPWKEINKESTKIFQSKQETYDWLIYIKHLICRHRESIRSM